MKSVVTPRVRSVSSSAAGAVGAIVAPKRIGNSTCAPSPNVNASGGVPEKTSVGRGLRGSSAANVSQHASRSRWKWTQPFGVPVVPEVNAMIATSSAAVSTGVERAARGEIVEDEARSSGGSATRVAARGGERADGQVARDDSRELAGSQALSAGLRDDLGDLARAQQRHRRDDDPAGQQDRRASAAIASAVLGECSSTRAPGSIASAPAIATARSASSA